MTNYGLLEGRKASDYVGGILPYQIRNPSGDWEQALPDGEMQIYKYGDSMACVTFSLLNSIETQEAFLTGARPNYSDRWIAMMSDTQPNGNYLYKVADAVKKYGLVKEESWPAPEKFSWEAYYAQPTPEQMQVLLAEGEKWKETHAFSYEWLDNLSLAEVQKQMKQAPLQVTIPGHAILDFYQEADVTNYFDSYDPYKKQTALAHLTDAMKPILTMKNMAQFKTQNKDGELRLVLQTSSPAEWEAICKVYGLAPTQIDEVVKSA